MIRAWTILEPKAKNVKAVSNGREFQYPIFPTIYDAKRWLSIPIGPANKNARYRIVRCQVRS